MRRIGPLLSLLVLMGLCHLASARVVDGIRAQDVVLRSIADFLDTNGVDVRNGKGTVERSPIRPQLTDLSNFPADRRIAGSANAFDPAFSASVSSERAYLVAVDHPGTPQSASLVEFKSAWEAAPQAKRIFISFSGKDLEAAQIVARALRSSGYFVFLYKNNSAELPAVNSAETGQFFREAGHHYVIDTSNARSSAAVNAEALAIGRRNSRFNPPNLFGPPNSSNDEPCCKLCHYVNGRLVGCDPPMCGTVCAGARPPL